MTLACLWMNWGCHYFILFLPEFNFTHSCKHVNFIRKNSVTERWELEALLGTNTSTRTWKELWPCFTSLLWFAVSLDAGWGTKAALQRWSQTRQTPVLLGLKSAHSYLWIRCASISLMCSLGYTGGFYSGQFWPCLSEGYKVICQHLQF